jgi:hypothetical protein
MSEDNDIRPSISSKKSKKTYTFSLKSVIGILAIVILLALSFWAGSDYQKHHEPKNTNATATANQQGGAGRFGQQGHRNIDVGTVSAISSSSITINSQQSGAAKTYAITSTTTINDSGQTVTFSDIQTGERVVVIPSTSNSADAATIAVNPSFGGFGGGGSGTGGN